MSEILNSSCCIPAFGGVWHLDIKVRHLADKIKGAKAVDRQLVVLMSCNTDYGQ